MSQGPWGDGPVGGDTGGSGSLDPEATAEQLRILAAERPDLWPDIWQHPNCYDGLRKWMADRYWAVPGGSDPERASKPAQVLPQTYVAPEGPTYAGVEPEAFSGGPDEPRRRRGKGVIVVSVVLIVLLALGGGVAALALTGNLDRWLSGGTAGRAAETVAEADAEIERASFANGIEKRWTVESSDLGGSFMLYTGRGAQAVGFEKFSADRGLPVPFTGGVIAPYSQGGSSSDFGIAHLAAQDGGVLWNEPLSHDFPHAGCVADPSGELVYCLMGAAGKSELLTFDSEGLAARTSVPGGYRDLVADRTGVSAAGERHVARFERDGSLAWQSELDFGGGSEYIEVSAAMDRTLVRVFPGGWQLFDEQGTAIAGQQSDTVEAAFGLRSLACDAAIAGERLFLLGDCGGDVRADDMEVTELDSVPGSVQLHPAASEAGTDILTLREGQELEMFSVYSASSGERLWSFMAMQHSVVLERLDDRSAVFTKSSGEDPFSSLVEVETGAFQHDALPYLGAGTHVVPGVLLGTDWGEQNAVLRAVDPLDGAGLWEMDLGRIWSMPLTNGYGLATLAWDLDDRDRMSVTFYAPAEEPSSEDIELIAAEAPDFIPTCPGDTILLAWAEFADGWVVVCGVDVNTPSYVEIKLPGKSSAVLSTGASKPSSAEAKAAVKWDRAAKRYIAQLADGSTLVLDHEFGTATVRSDTTGETSTQQRMIRYIFVPIGTTVRTSKDAGTGTGAYGVRNPEATAEDQIRFMIEVLEKSYEGRALVKEALPKLQGCTASAGGYGDAIADMKAVRDNRAELLQMLDGMPVDQIPEGAQLLDDLRQGIQHSYDANVEYVAWAEAANASGCASLSAAGQASVNASDAPKERFASRWNIVVAPAYGVRAFDSWYI